MSKEQSPGTEIINRKARHEYKFLDSFEAGIVLTGSEVKSVRLGNANLKEAYCYFRKGELFIRGMHISEYKFGHQQEYDPVRVRKLLLHKRELKKIHRRVKEKGMTLVPYRLFVNDRGLIKVEVVLAQGKRAYDKRESIKARDTKRELERIKKYKL